jgi:hypothetical protein
VLVKRHECKNALPRACAIRVPFSLTSVKPTIQVLSQVPDKLEAAHPGVKTKGRANINPTSPLYAVNTTLVPDVKLFLIFLNIL